MYIYKYISLEINFAILHNINCTVYQYIYIPWIFPFLSYTYLWILLLQPLSAYPYFISLLHIPTSKWQPPSNIKIFPPPNGSYSQISTCSHFQMAAALKYQHILTSRWQLPSNINLFIPPDSSHPQISTYSHLQMAATLNHIFPPPYGSYPQRKGGISGLGGLMFERSSKVQQIWYSCSSKF